MNGDIKYEDMNGELVLPMLLACIVRNMNLPRFEMTTKTYNYLINLVEEDKSTVEDISEFIRKNHKAAKLVNNFFIEIRKWL